jgi:glucokinase
LTTLGRTKTGHPAVLLALDVGGTKTIVAAVAGLPSQGFRPLRPPVRFATPRDPETFLEAVDQAAEEALPPGVRPVAVGIGVPGPLDPVSGVIEQSTNLGWLNLPLAQMISDRFGSVPTRLNDDGNAGALGEAHAGAGRGANPFVFVTLGTGLGSGIVVDGRIVDGAHGAAGEVGHLAVGDRNGPRCGCGRRNCVEAWCGGVGLARRAREIWPVRRLPDGTLAPRDAAGIFALAGRGDPDATRLVLAARHALAIAVAAILSTLDPAAISVGGSIGTAQRSFVQAAVREGGSLVHRATSRRVEFRPPELGDASVLVGATFLAAEAAQSDR